jgi:hypothetical protein
MFGSFYHFEIVYPTEVCYLRLDFETFNLLGPVATDEADATNIACQDSFVVTVSTPGTKNY